MSHPWATVVFIISVVISIFGDEILQNWQEICVFTELPIDGQEGQFNNSDFRLRGLGIAFRHGVRSGLMNVALEAGCAPFHPKDQDRFEEYEKLVKTDSFRSFINISTEKLGVFHPVPERILCAGGQLMAEGALQLIQLGNFFLKRFESSELFAPDSIPSVSLLSTNYNRTVQSGIAFSSGFFYPMGEKIKKIDFQIGDSIFLCYKKSCNCPYLLKLWLNEYFETLNFLDQILEEVNRLKGEPAATFVRIISGHDVTLAAILDTLGLRFQDPPRYSSRIVLEIYEKEGSKFYFRLLFNGEDRTGELEFCNGLDSGLCSMERLEEFTDTLREMTKETRLRCFM